MQTIKFNSHLAVEHFLFTRVGGRYEKAFEQFNDILARFDEILLDPILLSPNERHVLPWNPTGVLLLQGVNGAPTSSVVSRDVLVRDRQEIPLLDRQLSIREGDDILQLCDYI